MIFLTGTLYLVFFGQVSPKLHENEENWNEKGVRPKFYYVGPPLLIKLLATPTNSVKTRPGEPTKPSHDPCEPLKNLSCNPNQF